MPEITDCQPIKPYQASGAVAPARSFAIDRRSVHARWFRGALFAAFGVGSGVASGLGIGVWSGGFLAPGPLFGWAIAVAHASCATDRVDRRSASSVTIWLASSLGYLFALAAAITIWWPTLGSPEPTSLIGFAAGGCGGIAIVIGCRMAFLFWHRGGDWLIAILSAVLGGTILVLLIYLQDRTALTHPLCAVIFFVGWQAPLAFAVGVFSHRRRANRTG